MMNRTGISCKRMTSHRYPCPRAPPAFRDEHCTETVPHADCRVCLSFSHLICTQKNSGQCSSLKYYICCMVDELIFMSKTDFHYRSYNYLAFLFVTTTACAVICGFSSLRTVSKHLFLKVLGYKCTLQNGNANA